MAKKGIHKFGSTKIHKKGGMAGQPHNMSGQATPPGMKGC